MKPPSQARFSSSIDLEGINDRQAKELLETRLREFQLRDEEIEDFIEPTGSQRNFKRSLTLASVASSFLLPNAFARNYRRLCRAQKCRSRSCWPSKSTRCAPALRCSDTIKTA